MAALAATLALAVPATGRAEDCPPAPQGATTIASPPVKAHWRAVPAPIGVSAPFALEIGLCPARAELVRVDATMPEHRHGMNYRVRLTPLGAGRWRADGLVWHMPGRWELLLMMRLDGQEHRLVQSVTLR